MTCSECGEPLARVEGILLPTSPPKYRYTCPNGHVEFGPAEPVT